MVLPLAGTVIFFTVIWFSKTSLFIAIVLIGVVAGLFSEFGQKETGLAQLINIIKYQIIKNTTYLGKIKYNGQLYDGKHKALISEDLYNKANKIGKGGK